jgi:hypothetical protein
LITSNGVPFRLSTVSHLWFYAVSNAAPDVGECASGSRKLRTAQHVGAASVARDAFAGGEKPERQVTHCDPGSRIGGHCGRAGIRIKSRFRTMSQLHAVGFIAAYLQELSLRAEWSVATIPALPSLPLFSTLEPVAVR